MRHRKPDLILLDLELPDFHGGQLIERIRADATWQDIPIVVISGQDEVNGFEMLNGPMMITKANGLVPGQVIQWIQCVLDTNTQPQIASVLPR